MERIFTKTKPEERTWAKLVMLNTIHWYCDGPKPTPEAIRYDTRVCQRKSVTNTSIFGFPFHIANFVRFPLHKWMLPRGE